MCSSHLGIVVSAHNEVLYKPQATELQQGEELDLSSSR